MLRFESFVHSDGVQVLSLVEIAPEGGGSRGQSFGVTEANGQQGASSGGEFLNLSLPSYKMGQLLSLKEHVKALCKWYGRFKNKTSNLSTSGPKGRMDNECLRVGEGRV